MTDTTGGMQGRQVTGFGDGARPWPRYFARMIDNAVISTGFFAVLAIAVEIAVPGGADRLLAMTDGLVGYLLNGFVTVAAVVPFTAALIAWAQTPGKWLLGIRVRQADERRMGFATALKRELWIVVRGLGLGLPLVSLITLVMSYTELVEDGATRWDRGLGSSVTHAPATAWWWCRLVLGAVIAIAFLALGVIERLASLGAR
jgi:uncharacterized RDD family membrane protein YckC